MTISIEERKKFVNDMKIELEIRNYGFEIKENNYNKQIYSKELEENITLDNIKNLKPIRELLIRLNIWEIRGKYDAGSILFREARRKIDYILSNESLKKCKINIINI